MLISGLSGCVSISTEAVQRKRIDRRPEEYEMGIEQVLLYKESEFMELEEQKVMNENIEEER